MLDIGQYNLFIADGASRYGVIKVLEYYDLDGINWIFLHRDKSNLKYLIKNNKIIYTPSKLDEVFANGNNLFKVDMVVIECENDITHIIREQTKVPIIVISNNINRFSLDKYDYVYNFHFNPYEIPNGFQANSPLGDSFKSGRYMVARLQEKIGPYVVRDEYDLNDIYLSKIRDKKIDNLLD